jgi:hypothetical protein
MRNSNNAYVGRALWVLAGYFDLLGYPDSWLLQVAGEAARNWNWSLAHEAIATFEHGRRFGEFGELGERALDYLKRIVSNEEVQAYSGVYVELQEEELTEDLPL